MTQTNMRCRGSSSSSLSANYGPMGPVTFCDCGVETYLTTAWQGDYPGRRFYGCGNYRILGRNLCKFFKWFDGEGQARDMKIIATLTKKNDELLMKQKFLLVVIGILVCVVFMLFGLIAIK